MGGFLVLKRTQLVTPKQIPGEDLLSHVREVDRLTVGNDHIRPGRQSAEIPRIA